MTITDHPLHRSGRALLTHPALALGDDPKALRRIRVMEHGSWQPKVNQTAHPFPSQPRLLAASPQRAIPSAANVETKHRQRAQVCRHPVISVVSCDYRAQPFDQTPSLHSLRHRHCHFVRRCADFVRGLRRYYASVRLPASVHHRRTSLDFPMPPQRAAGVNAGSPGARAGCFRACLGS
jgi:hypothetical protein